MPKENDTQVSFWLPKKEKDFFQEFARKHNNSGLSEFIRKCMQIVSKKPSLLEEFLFPEEESLRDPFIIEKFEELAQLREKEKHEQEEIWEKIKLGFSQLDRKVNWLMDQKATTKKKKSEVKELKGDSTAIDMEALGFESS
jgi:hypothetical protein